jgi:4-amino-4-deoxy-L-arabinose transferase-like glycosyltransferase
VVAGLWGRFGRGGWSISHYDEGVYVLWGAGGFPGDAFFAPPLFPALLGGLFAWRGPDDAAAIALNGLFGLSTVLLVWWMARRWHGPAAGISAAALAALSDLHSAFSRSALTDPSFTFWFVCSVHCARELWVRLSDSRPVGGRVWRAVGLGLVCGAAMNTKYNGAATLIVAAAPLLPMIWQAARREPNAGRQVVRAGGFVLLAVAVALTTYAPWAWHVHARFGYGRLIAHQRGYTSGWAIWSENLLTQLLAGRFLSGGVSAAGPVVALILAYRLLPSRDAAANSSGRAELRRKSAATDLAVAPASQSVPYHWQAAHLLWPAVAALAVGVWGGDTTAWCWGLAASLAAPRPRDATWWLQMTWLVLLAIVTPFYHPYARLMLPLVPAGWIAGGAFLGRVADGVRGNALVPRSVTWHAAAWLFVAGAAAAAHWSSPRPTIRTETADSLADACTKLRAAMPVGQTTWLFARPPAVYHIGATLGSRRQIALLARLDEFLQSAPIGSVLLADECLLRDNAPDRAALERHAARLDTIGRQAYNPSPLVWADDYGRGVGLAGPGQAYALVLYRVRSSAERSKVESD